jgi:hypothetical protein
MEKRRKIKKFTPKIAECFVNRKKVGIFAVQFGETITKIIFGDEKNIPTFEQKKKEQTWFPYQNVIG